MKDIRTYIILGLSILIVLLFTCNDEKVKTEYKTVETVRVDSVHTTDTIVKEITNTIVKTEIDTFLSYYNDFNQLIREYHYKPQDSVLNATIKVFAQDKPDSIDFSYKLDQLTIKDSVYVRDSTHTIERKSFLSAGAMLTGSQNSFGFSPQLLYNHKKGNAFGVGYDVINGNLNISFYKRLGK